MFETLHDLDAAQLHTAADALHAHGQFAVLADPSGVYVLFKADPKLPYEVDFAGVHGARAGAPAPALSPLAYATILEWSRRNGPAVCKAWRARHPDAPRAPETRRMPRRKTRREKHAQKPARASLPDAFLREYPTIGLTAPPDVDRFHAYGINDVAAWISVAALDLPGYAAGATHSRADVLALIATLDSPNVLLLPRTAVATDLPWHMHIDATPQASTRLPPLEGDEGRDLGGMLYSFLMLHAHHWPEAARVLNEARVTLLGLPPIDPES